MRFPDGCTICDDSTVASTVWKGRLTFGMVSVPVRLYKAARRERIRFHHVYRPAAEPEPSDSADDLSRFEVEPPDEPSDDLQPVTRVRQAPLNDSLEAPILRESILKGFESEKDLYVVFEPREIAAIRPKTSSELQILEFIRLEEIDPIYFDASYYVAPDQGGEKPYALLFRAMQKAGFVAMGTMAMHGREHATVVRPGSRGLILHTLFYANEVRSAEEWQADTHVVAARELELAGLLVQAMEAKFEPEKLKDTFEERLRDLIDSRQAIGLNAGLPHASSKAPVVDIMDALRRSLEAKRKPVAKEVRQRKPAGKKRKPA